MALLGLGLLASAVVEVGSGSSLAREPYSAAKAPAANEPQVVEAYGKLPLSFEANQGQIDGRVDFLSRGSGYTLFLTPAEAVLALRKPAASSRARTTHAPPGNTEAEQADAAPPAVLRMKLVGANPAPRASGLEELPGKSNYFLGNDPDKWRTNVPHYAKVQYKDVYPGVDLVYYGNQRQLEYDLVVRPGSDPNAIALSFEGVESLRIDTQGDLLLDTADGEVRQHNPLVYQELDSGRREIPGSYVLKDERQVGFQVGAYDTSKPLTIDPVLVYSTYLGGSGFDKGFGIAVDASGNAYVTGNTLSTDFPTASPFQAALASTGPTDAFVTKLNAAGSALVYSTYLGGSASDGDSGGIAVDTSGNAYVTGRTASSDFPTASPFQAANGGGTDAFVTKLNAAGNALVYSTYLGGSGTDIGFDIAVDGSGNAYAAGCTDSTDFPTASPVQAVFGGGAEDAFVTKLNAAGSALVYSTYLGGSASDLGRAIAADTFGNAYATGTTFSTDFPTASPFQAANAGFFNAFVTKLNAAGSALVYSTYLGGSNGDDGFGIAADGSGNAYVTGDTSSTDFPTASPFQASISGTGDAFVTKLNAAGSALVYSTYLGGSIIDFGFGIAVDGSGNAYVLGRTTSTDFPTVSPIQAAYGGGFSDAFVAKLNSAGGALVYSTYLGGSGVDSSGNAYVTGFTPDFPTANPFQSTNAGGLDAFIAKIGQVITPPVCTYAISPTSESFPASGGTGSVLISTRCGWNAKSDASWITITSGSSGGGSGRVEYSVEANPDTGSRMGTLTITGGQILTVTQAGTATVPPALTVGPPVLGFSATVGDPPTLQGFQIGSDGGPVNWTATVRLLNGSGWLTISPSSGAASLTQPAVVIATVNYGALGGAGVFQAEITVTDTATGSSVTVQMTAVLSAPVARLSLSQTTFVFQGVSGWPAPPQSLTVFNQGTATLNWSLSGLPPWLTASPPSGAAGAGSSSLVTLTPNLSLVSSINQALVTVSAPGASNAPQLFAATLNVVPTSTSASADLSPNGLWFVAEPGVTLQQSGTVPGAQDLTVNNTGGGTLTADFVAATSSGGEWLMVSPPSGTASGGPFPTQVSVNPVGLAPGVYRGTVDGSFSSSGPQEVEVLLIVTPPGTSLQTQSGLPGATQCAPSGLQLLSTTIGSGLSLPVSFPRVLTALVVDDCGSTVDNATLVASVEGLNIPLRGLGTGFYSGTWVPVNEAAEVAITFAALHPTFAQVQRSFTVSTAAAPGAISLPALFADGVAEGAGFTKRRPLSPGGIVSLFGERFATENSFATQLPLERELAGISVRIGGQDAPLYFVSPGQINAQIPFEVSTGDSVPVAISVGGLLTAPQNYLIAPAQPGIFIAGDSAAILDASFQLVTAQNPARPGDTIQIFATGLGTVNEQVETGAPAPSFSTVQLPVTVTIGGINAPVVFQGLAPGFVGLYQVNAVVPSGVEPGNAVPLVLEQNGIIANPDQPVTIPVQAP